MHLEAPNDYKIIVETLTNKQKFDFLGQARWHKAQTKKLDNIAVIKGSTRNLITKSVTDLNKEPMEVSGKNRLKGNGYLYSKALMEDLRAPFANPYRSPMNKIQGLYSAKNKDIQRLSQIIAVMDMNNKSQSKDQ